MHQCDGKGSYSFLSPFIRKLNHYGPRHSGTLEKRVFPIASVCAFFIFIGSEITNHIGCTPPAIQLSPKYDAGMKDYTRWKPGFNEDWNVWFINFRMQLNAVGVMQKLRQGIPSNVIVSSNAGWTQEAPALTRFWFWVRDGGIDTRRALTNSSGHSTFGW